MEREPGEQRGEHAFQIEHQRRARRPGGGEPDHEENRADDAAGEHRAEQPGKVAAPQRRLAPAR